MTLTPVEEGRLEVYLNGETLCNRKDEGGKYPGLDRVSEMKRVAKDKIAAVAAH